MRKERRAGRGIWLTAEGDTPSAMGSAAKPSGRSGAKGLCSLVIERGEERVDHLQRQLGQHVVRHDEKVLASSDTQARRR